MQGFIRAAALRQAETRYADACAMRAAFAEDARALQSLRPDRGQFGAVPDRAMATVDLPDDELDDYLHDLGFYVEREPPP
jgi:hypothetical protein